MHGTLRTKRWAATAAIRGESILKFALFAQEEIFRTQSTMSNKIDPTSSHRSCVCLVC